MALKCRGFQREWWSRANRSGTRRRQRIQGVTEKNWHKVCQLPVAT